MCVCALGYSSCWGGGASLQNSAMTAHTTAGRSGDTPLGGAEGERSREERSEAEEKRSTLSVSDSTATSF